SPGPWPEWWPPCWAVTWVGCSANASISVPTPLWSKRPAIPRRLLPLSDRLPTTEVRASDGRHPQDVARQSCCRHHRRRADLLRHPHGGGHLHLEIGMDQPGDDEKGVG